MSSKYDWAIINSAKELSEESQKETFPYMMDPPEVYGLRIQVNRHVFSPKHAKGYRFFIPRLQEVKGKRVLEIGCGHGVVSCYLALRGAKYVLAIDINPAAVENTRINAELNQLNNLETRVSDVFSEIKEDEKFDIVFWNTPWAKVPEKYEQSMTPEDYGMFDVEYRAISKFILEGKKYLTSDGAIYLGFGGEGADSQMIEDLIAQAALRKEVIADDSFSPGERINDELIKFHMKLYRLS